ncbi:MAG: UPF0262 family protein [Alphaproteobacteria bacterium]|nr:UPF0262 family protein [Alphaproteobacteria bacterium]
MKESGAIQRARHIENERNVAINDLLLGNRFCLEDAPARGPYKLCLEVPDAQRLHLLVTDAEEHTHLVNMSLRPYRALIKDYFIICESYFNAIRTLSPGQIETIDMARRGLHDEGSQLMRDALGGTIGLDKATARRLFTLVCVLHIRA